MKSFVSALVVLALLLTGFGFYHWHLTRQVDRLCFLAESGDIPALTEAFLESKPFFGVFLNHQEVGTLEDAIARLQVFYRSENETDRLCEQALFVSRLRALYENEGLGLSNVL